MEFNNASKATPTSPNTAIHIEAISNKPKTINRALILRAKIIFCHIIFFVFLEI